MQRIRYVSDLHYGVNRKPFIIRGPRKDEQVLILAGDIIDNGMFGIPYVEKFCEQFQHVFMIPGNHEYYSQSVTSAVKIVKHQFKIYPDNLHYDEMQVLELDEVVIIGATLWTDLSKLDYFELLSIRKGMADYFYITQTDEPHTRLMDSTLWQQLHDTHLKFIADQYDKFKDSGKRIIVVTHHAPSHQSIHSMFKGSKMNGGFVSDLDQFILDRPLIADWIHGHTHSRLLYKLGDTTIHCNPAGYRGEVYNKKDELKFDPLAHIVV